MTTEASAPARVPTDTTFAARLAMVRHLNGWNVKEAAKLCGVPAATWRLWELDGAIPRNQVVTAKQIAAAADVDYHWLLDGEAATRRYGDPLMPRVVASAGRVIRQPVGPGRPRGSVARTRPIAAGATRPVTPVAV